MLKRKHRIIPILLEDISSVKATMDKNLKGIMDSVTYLEWPGVSCEKKEEKFWKRLTLSLPKKKESSFESNIMSSGGFDSNKLSSSNFDSNKISSNTFSNNIISSSNNIISGSNISSMNSESILSLPNVKIESSKVSEWLSTISDKIDQTEEPEDIYCEISQIDEQLNKHNMTMIPTLSETEEEAMIGNYQRSHSCNTDNMTDQERNNDVHPHLSYNCSAMDNERKSDEHLQLPFNIGTMDDARNTDGHPHFSCNNEGRSAIQTQLSYNQSEVSSPTDSLAPLWVDKSEEEVEEKTKFRKFLKILDSVTEV